MLHGLVDPALLQRVSRMIDSRLAASSKSTIKTAWSKHWEPFCAHYELDLYIPSGSPRRGAIMSTFILYMCDHAHLKFKTLQGYIWAIVDSHLSAGYASPLANVRDWGHFMRGIEFEVDSSVEPRLMVPWLLFVRSLPRFNVSQLEELSVCLLILLVFFLASRVEFLPTTQGYFDLAKHLTCSKIRTVKGYIEVNLVGVKQDPLNKRPEHSVAGDCWRAIGPGKGIFDTRQFLDLYLRVTGTRGPDEPFFLDSRRRPLTQPKANEIFRSVMARVPDMTRAVADKYSLIGLRVLGRNAIAGAAGDETARIQGMWDVCDVYYDRPMIQRVLALPGQMAAFAASAAMPSGGLLDMLQASPPLQAPALVAPAPAHSPSPPASGVTTVPHHTPKRTYFTYEVDGISFRSRCQAEQHLRLRGGGDSAPSGEEDGSSSDGSSSGDSSSGDGDSSSSDGSGSPAADEDDEVDGDDVVDEDDEVDGDEVEEDDEVDGDVVAAVDDEESEAESDSEAESSESESSESEEDQSDVVYQLNRVTQWELYGLVPPEPGKHIISNRSLWFLQNQLRRQTSFIPGTHMDLKPGAFQALKEEVVRICLNHEAEPYHRGMGVTKGDYAVSWTSYFASFRKRAEKLVYDGGDDQKSRIALISIRVGVELASQFESPFSRAQGPMHFS